MSKAEFIYIDHNTINLKGELFEFIKSLKSRILRINPSLKVLAYDDIHDKSITPDKVKTLIDNASDAISKSLITIGIITNSYVDEVNYNERLVAELEKINKTENRYFIPIIFEKTNWLNAKWLIKLKLYPSSTSVQELSDVDKNSLIEEIGSNIEIMLLTSQNSTFNLELKSTIRKNKADEEKLVFISHSHLDSDFAELLQLKLKESGINSWIDGERLKIGQDWREEIDKGIDDALALIVIMTPDAKSSEYVTYEWAYAWGKGIPIFPIMLEQTSLHPRLESLQYLNFTLRQSRPYDELFRSIQNLRN